MENQGSPEEEDSGSSLMRDASEETPKTSSKARRNPPARITSRFWFERFLTVIQRQNPPVIDSSFLSQIASNNEGKLLSQLKFLKAIDDQGRPTQILPLLNLVGDEQKKGFREMTENSYSDLLNEVKIEKALPDDVVNYFIRKYSYTRDKAVYATKFFLYLADKSSIPISQELRIFYSEKTISTQSNGLPSATQVPPVLALRNSVDKTPLREQRIATKNGVPSQKRGQYAMTGQPSIQATVEIKLDKDTPRELWDRVLALLGEKRNESSVDSQDSKIDA